MNKSAVPGVRHDFKTGQYVPTINGKDFSPTSFDRDTAFIRACRETESCPKCNVNRKQIIAGRAFQCLNCHVEWNIPKLPA